jgi:putative ABC transport system ATP-binding protein
MIKAQCIVKQLPIGDDSISILDGVNMTIAAGESVAITGASGCGKSTLLGLLAGLDTPSSGQIWLDGQEITSIDEDARAQVRSDLVGFVFQSFQLLPALTALENVMLPLELKGADDPIGVANMYLDKVGLSARLDHYPRQLSGGEQQRVAVARAFASRPSILFADEPTGNLDQKTGEHIVELLFDLNHDAGTTLVLVTHDTALSSRCQRHFRLDEGRLHEVSPGC